MSQEEISPTSIATVTFTHTYLRNCHQINYFRIHASDGDYPLCHNSKNIIKILVFYSLFYDSRKFQSLL